MEPLHNKSVNNVPNAESTGLLYSNKEGMRGSALGFNQEPLIQVLLDQLEALIVEAYFYEKRNSKPRK